MEDDRSQMHQQCASHGPPGRSPPLTRLTIYFFVRNLQDRTSPFSSENDSNIRLYPLPLWDEYTLPDVICTWIPSGSSPTSMITWRRMDHLHIIRYVFFTRSPPTWMFSVLVIPVTGPHATNNTLHPLNLIYTSTSSPPMAFTIRQKEETPSYLLCKSTSRFSFHSGARFVLPFPFHFFSFLQPINAEEGYLSNANAHAWNPQHIPSLVKWGRVDEWA